MSSIAEDDADRQYIPERDGLAGPTQADNERHVIARSVLVNILLYDRRVVALFDATMDHLDVDRARAAVERAAAVFREHGVLDYPKLGPGEPEAIEVTDEEARIVGEAASEMEALIGRSGSEGLAGLTEGIGGLIASWRVSWTWLVYELISMFALWVDGYVTGRVHTVDVWHEAVEGAGDVPASVLGISASETISTLYERIEAFLKASGQPAGRRVSEREALQILDDVFWLYRVKLKAPPDGYRTIARERAGAKASADDIERERQAIRRGVKRAWTFLGYAP